MSVKDGLSSKKSFKPSDNAPPETKHNGRTKPNDPMIHRKPGKHKGCK